MSRPRASNHGATPLKYREPRYDGYVVGEELKGSAALCRAATQTRAEGVGVSSNEQSNPTLPSAP